MTNGYLSLVLHAHLPFVRHPEFETFLEEKWLFEALSETYLPLLRVFKRLEKDDVPFKMTFSISPTLAAMLGDEVLQDRYIRHLDSAIELAEKEVKRTKGDEKLHKLARMYQELFEQNKQDFIEIYEKNILLGFDYFAQKGYLELITTSATHAYLPLYSQYPEVVHAQIKSAVDEHTRLFGTHPGGLWLPECGYFEGLDDILDENGIDYCFTAAHGLLFADNRPRNGVYAPIKSPKGVYAFGRDLASANAVWSESDGYPGDYSYRDFYRDIGFDLNLDYVKDYILDQKVRTFTGFKYYSITGNTDDKMAYDPEVAAFKVQEHAENFIYNRKKQIDSLLPLVDKPPVVNCFYDAELFGHWWFEGPLWIEALFRQLATHDDYLAITTAKEYLAKYPEQQKATPAFSSWGNKGYSEVWLEQKTSWIYRHTHKISERMIELVERYPNATGLQKRILDQAAREVMLSQSSDWPFIIRAKTAVDYSVRRIKEHVSNFNKIYDSLCSGDIDTQWITSLEKKYIILPEIDYKDFKAKTKVC